MYGLGLIFKWENKGANYMYISVDESQMSVFFLDCFRFCLDGTEYNVLLNTRDVDVYEYEIWKRDNREMSLMKIVTLSLDEFKEYYFADERTTNYEIVNQVILPAIKKMI